ncbi:hypothetical protein [Colwellia psychrerythraea]|uniref:Cellobiose phosphorylase n=1 Tax=Colwellia psychrerythraea (strain 34H / ATCC BAA-681) TaxID=167879 RepID=Q47XT1_COLP3|nr:hypothetical protein [Colwellia psychrerythraea]AAZ28070.1 hypothetical protein CPS_3722 [Colwellia psychrerythraea 34H]
MKNCKTDNNQTTGEFIMLDDERYYAINNVNNMAPFFISVISNSDHWLFVSSTGGLTAGRVSPETALFPYITVDRIHESDLHTGCKTLLRVDHKGEIVNWEPFNREHDNRYKITRNLYKNLLGNKLCFEEINNDLQLKYKYTWATSEEYGFVRQCELVNLSDKPANVELIDGFQNILPAGTPRFTQTNSSNLVDAYKWTELDESSGLAFFTVYSGITDRAEPCESLKTNTVFCSGLEQSKILLSSEQLANFRTGMPIKQETHKRGIRGAFLVNSTITLEPLKNKTWQFVANVEQSQSQATELRSQLSSTSTLENNILSSIAQGSDGLARIMATADGFQVTAEENVSVHHYANVQFNVLRGGAFDEHYQISSKDFSSTVNLFNSDVYLRHQEFFRCLPESINIEQLLTLVKQQEDQQLERLCYEYLPIFFGRRHGDPSRPWNQFAIKLKDDNNNSLLTYQGNWRDIFQNWEALTFSYPKFIENVIAKFVNASTIDGYNPYRITKEGIDWEVEEPDDPWSYIGYWGDHQIIYLQKMLELSKAFHPDKLSELLRQPLFSYANVPYRIKPFDALVKNAKSTVTYDEELAERIEKRVSKIGADGKLMLDSSGEVYQVNLLEKLMVPLLCKLGNLVIDGGIWLNTQRPEWNDANNALVGQGVSVVTLYYLRRYVCFLQKLLAKESESTIISKEVNDWIVETANALKKVRPLLNNAPISADERYQCASELGQASSRYRETIYSQEAFSGKMLQPIEQIKSMLEDALAAIEHTIHTNEREDGLYNAYNLLAFEQESLTIDDLYPMLEGQVAALSSGAFSSEKVISVVEALFKSDVYRKDQDTFMLYPDRKLPSFLQKNCVDTNKVQTNPLLKQMLREQDERIILQDSDGVYRFNADLTNGDDLMTQLDALSGVYGDLVEMSRSPLVAIYEEVFNHQEFTGRSGGMFGFEGLGCIYWHMVAKLLLAVEENFFTAVDNGEDEGTCSHLGKLYYRVREGLGFNKTPSEYGAFPADPYSHTPKHAGAQQPGMTGQVKEEILARFGELGIRVKAGTVQFQTNLLRPCEFVKEVTPFTYLDVDDNWQEITVPESGLAFTWCQVPIVYQVSDREESTLTITWEDGRQQILNQLTLPEKESSNLFLRNGHIRQISLNLNSTQLFSE